ncbi:MAG: sugar phosphate isomerase/epimerase [Brachybacterium sp.]|nr:sugar phosphate isomerase/epimerase [Brachybacterium sp.]
MLSSVQLYSVRDSLAHDAEGTLRSLRSSGFERVEPFALLQHQDMLRDLLPTTGLQAPSAHASLLDVEDPGPTLRAAADLGVDTVIEPYWNPEDWESEAGVRSVADRLNALVGPARDHGVRIGYHNHDFECVPHFEGLTGLEVLAQHLAPEIVLELDTYWAAVGGSDPTHLLGALGERVQLLHLKDGPITKDTAAQLPLGEGAMDVPSILRAAPWVEYGVIEFDDYADDVLDGVAQSLTYLGMLTPAGGTGQDER